MDDRRIQGLEIVQDLEDLFGDGPRLLDAALLLGSQTSKLGALLRALRELIDLLGLAVDALLQELQQAQLGEQIDQRVLAVRLAVAFAFELFNALGQRVDQGLEDLLNLLLQSLSRLTGVEAIQHAPCQDEVVCQRPDHFGEYGRRALGLDERQRITRLLL